MSKKALLGIVLLLALVVAGCRVRDASDSDPREPTLRSNDSLVNVTNTPPPDEFETPTSETLPGNESPTATITSSPFVLPSDTPTVSASETPSFPSETPQGGIVTAEPGSGTVVVDLPSPTLEFPSDTPTQAFSPSPFPTDTPTATATSTATPTSTDTATFTPSATITPAVTATFTEFPTLTPSPQGIAVQVTVNDQQATATAIILTFEASQGTFYPTQNPNVGPDGQVPTQDPNLPQVTQQPEGPTAIPPGFFPDCDYPIDPGERLGNIAITYNLSIEELAAYNDILNPDFIKAGDTIKIPGCGQNPTATPTFTPDPTQTLTYNNSAGPIQYTVETGDNIYRLSVKFGVTMAELMTANPSITNINLIIAGDTLTIPTRSQFETTPAPTLAPTQGEAQQSVPAFPTATLAG